MKIQYASDLHLEFATNQRWLAHNPIIPECEVFILAGDTYYLNRGLSQLSLIQKLSSQFEEIWIIPGNHEFYEGEEVSAYFEPVEMCLAFVFSVKNLQFNGFPKLAFLLKAQLLVIKIFLVYFTNRVREFFF